ncbi:MAG: hypothetical protein ACTHOO_05185 [Alcanivorax sp.]
MQPEKNQKSSESDNKLLPEQEEIFRTVGTVNAQLETLETFIARRFDEISMEINAASQQFDMAEDGIIKRFSEVLELLGAINYSGDGNTAANQGVELEAIIADTEKAANNILDASDRIVEHLDNDDSWKDKDTLNTVRESIRTDVQEILMACSFQDLTGQRIRNTLDSLHGIEERLQTSFERLGIEVKADSGVIKDKVKEASSQGDIDALFDDAPAGGTASQDDIDGMFD